MAMNQQLALPIGSEQHVPRPVPLDGESSKAAQKRRSKTFTGCWTCRSRRVKCDEQKPACERCLAGGFGCQGYGTRLTWVSQAGRVPARGHRGAPTQCVDLDADTARVASRTTTPIVSIPCRDQFVVFRVGHANRTKLADRTKTSRKQHNGVGSDGMEATAHSHVSGHPFSLDTSPYDTTTPLSDNRTSSTTTTLQTSLISSLATPLDPPWAIDSSPTEPGDLDSSVYFANDGSWVLSDDIGHPSRAIEQFPAASRQRELINHWVTNLAHKLMPIRSAINPLLTIASPMALEGSRIPCNQSSSTAAVFHAVCALSAAHQDNLRGSSGQASAVTLYHKRQSFQHLMKNIDSTDIDDRMASLATLCMWMLTHFVSGTAGAWRELVKVTRNLIEQTSRETWTQSVTASLTYQSFASFITLVQSQYMGRLEFPKPMSTSFAGDEFNKSLATPDKSLRLISIFNMKLLEGGVMEEALDDLEMEFALTTPPIPTSLDMEKPDSAMVHHHRSLFYYACLLYFRCNSGRRGSEDEVQSLVDRCLEHMEHLDSMQLGVSPRAWVCAVVAFEAGTPASRGRVRASFAKRKDLGISAWDTLLLAAEEMWKQRDKALPWAAPEPWTRVLPRIPQFDIVLY